MNIKRVCILMIVTSFLCACQKNNIEPIHTDDTPKSEVKYKSAKYKNSLQLINYDNSLTPFLGADPDIIKADDGYYYMYTSQNFVKLPDKGNTLDYCPIYKSEDMVNWRYCSSAFLDQNFDVHEHFFSDVGIWAPSINYFFGQYYLYYSIGYSWNSSENHEAFDGIGLAISDTPYGPWKHYGELFNSTDCDVPISIDPFAYQEDNEDIYLIWGSYYGIFGVKMAIDGIEVLDKENIKTNKIEIVKAEYSGDKNYEGTYIFKKDGKYYFSGSKNGYGGGLNSKYCVFSGMSDSLLGPYVGTNGKDVFGGGDKVIDGDFNDPEGLRGTGHHAIIQDDAGDYWIIYHCYDPSCPIKDERTIAIDKLIFEENGAFHTENYVGSHVEKDGPRVIDKEQ